MYDWPTDKRQGHICVPPPKAPAGGGCALPYVEVSNSGPCEVKLELFNVPEWAENAAIQGIFPGGVRFYDCNNGDQLSRSAIPPEVTCIIIKIPAAGAI